MYACEFCGKEYLNFDEKESCFRKCLKTWMEKLFQSIIPQVQQTEAAQREERRKENELNIAGNLTNIWASLHKEPLPKEAVHEAFMWFWTRFWPSETVSVSRPPQYPDVAP